ncbi:recombinase zinc beta ribbon domain-containing protein [Actinotignum urinale]|uniref:recombinase zinc beta ribbon domain-containing protein n=1 Tax=Actinotignum urinale TaxID=190146 RepID=UPI0011AEE2D4|nr:recombinase zinc beta ribbon domain-containing protein [Actinotignum urinale]WIK58765.1 recombinase zinc beta ribbon domain-containing protein [Actinotignum urinale]
MPQLVDDETFEVVHRRMTVNKRRGARTKAQLSALADDAPDYWLTGRMYCRNCGASMQGVSDTSKTGKKHYYYCSNQRKKKCSARPVRKTQIEEKVTRIIEDFLYDTEMLASLAVDLAAYYKESHARGDEKLRALEARRKEVEIKLGNFAKAIAQGIFNDTTAEAMRTLEEQKRELDSAIQTEHVKASLLEDEASIGSFFKKYAKANLDSQETRDQLFEYFVDKIFVDGDEVVVVTLYYDTLKSFDLEELEEALQDEAPVRELRIYGKEFDTSPSGYGIAGIDTKVRVVETKQICLCSLVIKPKWGFYTCSNAPCVSAEFNA